MTKINTKKNVETIKYQIYNSLDKYFFNPDFHKFELTNSDTHSADSVFNSKTEYTGCEYDKLKLLWKLVIIRALLDATSGSDTDELIRDNAKNWLQNNSKDFRSVCSMADIEPSIVQKIAKQALENPKEWHKQALIRYKAFSSKARTYTNF